MIEYVDRGGAILPTAPELVTADSSTMEMSESIVMLDRAAEQLFGPEPLGGRPFRAEVSVCEPECEEVLLPLDLEPVEATAVSLELLRQGFDLTETAISNPTRWRMHVDPANGVLARLESSDGSFTTAFHVHRIVFFPPAERAGGAAPPRR